MILGLDIGGANLKAADSQGSARTLPFALWKDPGRLPDMLCELLGSMPAADVLAVTMTGELCDCFATKHEGVLAILAAVEAAVSTRSAGGPPKQAGHGLDDPGPFRQFGTGPSTNLASGRGELAGPGVVCREAHTRPTRPADRRRLDHDRHRSLAGRPAPTTRLDRCGASALSGTGLLRRAANAVVCPAWTVSGGEFFATTLDVNLMLNLVPEDDADRDTADGRPASRVAAHARLAHMLCGDATMTAIR